MLELGETDTDNIAFTSIGTLQLDDPSGFAGVLEGLTVGDLIDLPSVNPIGTTASLQASNLIVSENGTPIFTFALGSTFSGESFKVTSHAGGTEIAVLAGPSTGSIDQWLGGNSNWNSASKWSLGIPTSTTQAAITPASPATVTIPVGYTATAAALSIGTGSQISIGGSTTLVVGGALVMQADGLAISGGTASGVGSVAEISAGSVTIEGGSYVDHLAAGDVVISSESFTNEGTYTFSGARGASAITINSNVLGTGTLAFGGVSASAVPGESVGASVMLELGETDTDNIAFTSIGTLQLDDPSGFAGVLEGLTVGDLIDLPSVNPIGTTASLQAK